MKIISGGQTGADQGALAAAKQLGLETGGWIPRGFLTEHGFNPMLGTLYGLQEYPSEKYPPRTRANVRDADVTVWVGEADAYGYIATKNACDDLQKEFLDNPTAERLRGYVEMFHCEVVNIAGPRASKDRDAYQRAVQLVLTAFGPEE